MNKVKSRGVSEKCKQQAEPYQSTKSLSTSTVEQSTNPGYVLYMARHALDAEN